MRWTFVMGLVLIAAGCNPVPVVPPIEEDAGRPHRDSTIFVADDADGDGLCDDTEITWGTDPDLADSDDDGLTDRAEHDFGYLPRDPASPDREILVFVSENAVSTTTFPVTRIVTGEGETFTGSFEALPVLDDEGVDASDFVALVQAVGAVPQENVFEVHGPEQQFIGVFGRTQLVFEVRFSFEGLTERGCIRGYPFRYPIKRQDGAVFSLNPYLMLVLPRGQRLDTAEWCPPTTCL